MALGTDTPEQPERPKTADDELREMVDSLLKLKLTKNSKYTDSPINILPDKYWLAQIVIKAMRAEQCKDASERVAELDDVIVYCLLEKLKTAGWRI